ncbi:ABC transporter substrate-binding protein [Chromobacterium sp. IIBBL 290-4]|uniref:substrate-binding periplasmic protein n=1 Tax=Chromobacterium sp. IIBBL 290-4 TaxID=2953890 RepID=UPI0020B73507|nr:transporter substrate-binding domain-containing protein [Chromobacterium sp. IIBBL 290-4]UTH76049.1 transporter substrate-binding domain-containing protein [Chromobacterium sp. IIBBL 290-4]
MRSILLSLLMPAACFAAPPKTVTILTDNGYPPYSYEASGQAEGVYNDILRAASGKLRDYRIELKPVPWKRGLAELESGQALALSPPYYRPQDRPYIRPYSVPLLTEQVVVFCRAERMAKPRPAWPDDYRGLRFGNNAGFRPGGEAFWSLVKQGDIPLEEAADARTNLLKVIRGHLDCYLNDRLAIQLELERLRQQKLYQTGQLMEGAAISEEQGYVGFTDRDAGRFPYKQDFIEQLNRALSAMRRNGEIDRIVEKAMQTARRLTPQPPF